MDQYLVFAMIGLGVGCLYAAIGIGVIVTYRGTGVINFATGATAMWGTYVYAELRSTGDLVLPVVGMPHRVGLAGPTTFWPAFVLGVGSCALDRAPRAPARVPTAPRCSGARQGRRLGRRPAVLPVAHSAPVRHHLATGGAHRPVRIGVVGRRHLSAGSAVVDPRGGGGHRARRRLFPLHAARTRDRRRCRERTDCFAGRVLAPAPRRCDVGAVGRRRRRDRHPRRTDNGAEPVDVRPRDRSGTRGGAGRTVPIDRRHGDRRPCPRLVPVDRDVPGEPAVLAGLGSHRTARCRSVRGHRGRPLLSRRPAPHPRRRRDGPSSRGGPDHARVPWSSQRSR